MNGPDETFIEAARTGNLDTVRNMLDATRKAGILGIISTKLTGEEFDGTLEVYDRNRALASAAQMGHEEVVEYLIPLAEPSFNYSQALREAATYGHASIVERLIPCSDANALDGEALRQAAGHGHLDVVKQLLPHSDATEWSSGAIRKAAVNGHKDVVDYLYEHSKLDDALSFIDESDLDLPVVRYMQGRHQAGLDAVALQNATLLAAGAWSPDPKEADAQFERRYAEAAAQGQGMEPQQQRAASRMRL